MAGLMSCIIIIINSLLVKQGKMQTKPEIEHSGFDRAMLAAEGGGGPTRRPMIMTYCVMELCIQQQLLHTLYITNNTIYIVTA